MTISLELPSDVEARFVAEAKTRGVPVAEVVKAYLYRVPSEPMPRLLSAEEIDRELDAAADLIPVGINPIADVDMDRESIYSREDDWNL